EQHLEELEQVLGYHFREPALLHRALTHRSALPRRGSDGAHVHNEQFEYLGDAVLGLVTSEHLFREFPQWTEGQLSKGRARLVNASSLYSVVRRLGIGRFLRIGRGEEKTGGRDKPALLADAFEAIVAAVYLDGGLQQAREFVNSVLLQSAIKAEGARLECSDHKSTLQELLQARGLPAGRYDVVREAGPDHQKTFWVEVRVPGLVTATGSGSNKKEAEQAAAEQAIQRLRTEIA